MRVWPIGVFWTVCASAATAPDTVQLTHHLKAIRGWMGMPDSDFRRLQRAYLSWLDVRIQRNEPIEAVNRELKDAGLLPNWSDSVDEMDKSHAGYVEISRIKAPVPEDILVVAAGIYRGGGCSLDVTAAVYERPSLRRVAAIHAGDSGACYLSGLAVGQKDASGRRLVASGWVVSNCTSTWNGKLARIDRIEGSTARNILSQSLAAHDRDESDTVAVNVDRDTVTFGYDGATGDTDIMITPAIARYRIAGNRAIREGPIALTRAGFLYEWLHMGDPDAARWGEPEAVAKRSTVAAPVDKLGFKWASLARCGADWEVGLRLNTSGQLYVFRMAGDRANQLRMLGIADHGSPSCALLDIRKHLTVLGDELPQ